MSYSRYTILDAYTTEELRRTYQASRADRRIRIIRRLERIGRLQPIEDLAIAEADPLVRIWIARHSALGKHLGEDHEPFTRAAVRENPKVSGSGLGLWLAGAERTSQIFRESSELEGLALMRNPNLSMDVFALVFDLKSELAVSPGARAALALAGVGNKGLLRKLAQDADLGRRPVRRGVPDGWAEYRASKCLESVWESAREWPTETGVCYTVYRWVPAPDKTKCRHYAECNDVDLRGAILQGCTEKDQETLRVACRDEDDSNRYAAYRRIRHVTSDELAKILASEDISALHGLANNQSLGLEELRQIRDRAKALKEEEAEDDAQGRIEELEGSLPESPKELFAGRRRRRSSPEPPSDPHVHDKLNAIGHATLRLESALNALPGALTETVGSKLDEMVKAIAIALCVWGLLYALFRFVG